MSKHKSVLAPSLRIEPSRLFVKDLAKVGAFYHRIVGLDVLEQTSGHMLLGYGKAPIIDLISKPEYSTAPMPSAGLFHHAIVFASQAELAKTLLNIAEQAPDSYEGSADHLVSEAFYFHDPEFNGLELYYDRPETTWQWDGESVKMDSLPLNPQEFIEQHLGHSGSAAKTLGHVHLRVGDIPTARKFYVDQLGFDATADFGSALFISVGGYHHHFGMNVWQSKGAGMRAPSLGLAETTLLLPNSTYIDALANRLTGLNTPFESKNKGISLQDPWGNTLVIRAD